jgi:hypothetical protein
MRQGNPVPCVFCGHPKTSKEHVIPKWLGEVLRQTAPNLPKGVEFGDFVQTYVPPGAVEPSREWTTVKPDFQVNDVCERRCNNGWMNDMETCARPYLISMIQGRGRTLYDEGRTAVSAWAFKTWLMFQLMEAKDVRVAPAEAYPGFYRDRVPPPGVRIWLGAAQHNLGSWHRSTRFKAAVPESEAAYIYGATLSIGHLVFQVFGTEAREGDTRVVKGNLATLLTEVWPVEDAIDWPPAGGMLSPVELTVLSEAFTRTFLGPSTPR